MFSIMMPSKEKIAKMPITRGKKPNKIEETRETVIEMLLTR